jgi:hypothetical protein
MKKGNLMQHTQKDHEYPISATPWYKQFWPWFLIALPGSVVMASMFTITLAVQNAPVIVQKDIGRFVQPIEVNRDKE